MIKRDEPITGYVIANGKQRFFSPYSSKSIYYSHVPSNPNDKIYGFGYDPGYNTEYKSRYDRRYGIQRDIQDCAVDLLFISVEIQPECTRDITFKYSDLYFLYSYANHTLTIVESTEINIRKGEIILLGKDKSRMDLYDMQKN